MTTKYTYALLDRINEKLAEVGHGGLTMTEAEEVWGISEYDSMDEAEIDRIVKATTRDEDLI